MEGPHKEVQQGFPSERPFMSSLLCSSFPLLLVGVKKRPAVSLLLRCHERVGQESLQLSLTKANFKHLLSHSKHPTHTHFSSLSPCLAGFWPNRQFVGLLGRTCLLQCCCIIDLHSCVYQATLLLEDRNKDYWSMFYSFSTKFNVLFSALLVVSL